MFRDITEMALEDMKERSQKRIYKTDYAAWKADVLGFHTYQKMGEIMDEALFGDLNRTVIKSGNGVSKSYELAAAICWSASVFEPGEVLNIVSAPSEPQIKQVIFNYIKENYGRAIERGQKMQGFLTEDMGWKIKTLSGNISLVYGRAPNPHDAVSTFQGVRSQGGDTWLWYEEAGGMQPQMWTAAQAIITGEGARFVGIGNPDRMDTEFYNIFTEPKYEDIYNRFTISAYDLPTFTGERVYPRTEEGDLMEAQMLKNLTQVDWVEKMKVLWGEDDARFQSKVLGEFSSLGSNAFFKPEQIIKAYETEVIDVDVRPVLGMDVGAEGDDETVVYANWNGKLRHVESWGGHDPYESAQRIHRLAQELNAEAICIDSIGVGGGVEAALKGSEEFADGDYYIIGVKGSERSPEPLLWANMKTYNHEQLRKKMAAGEIDIDPNDTNLIRQLEAITYQINSRDRVMITPKDRIRKILGRSPDHLDAAVYACYDVKEHTGETKTKLQEGDIVVVDMFEAYEIQKLQAAGRPF